MQKKENIHIIITGGTIDKVYSPSQQDNVFKETSGLPDFLKGRIDFDVSNNVTQLMMIDSLDMTDLDREKLLDSINDSATQRIMVTHGTDTMIQTAKFIKQRISDKKNYCFCRLNDSNGRFLLL